MYVTGEWVGPQAYAWKAAAGDHRSNQRTTDMLSTSPKSLYASARKRGQRSQSWSILGRHADRLHALSEVRDACNVRARCHAGIRNVAISQIRGSEGRCNDFDGDFNPIQDHCMSRWLRIAAARDQGKVLPPVVLVQVGDVYFVRDGHHRISVARALGQQDIEAQVTLWQVKGTLPWEMRVGEGARHLDLAGQRHEDADRNKVLNLGPVAVWLKSLLPGRTRARGLSTTHSSAAA